MSWSDVRTTTSQWHLRVDEAGWGMRLAKSLGFAGFLSLMALISFPLPWTPVPFSMMPFALLVAGGYQRPVYAFLSVLIYLTAAAAGAPIFADGESGIRHLIGSTAGYLFGFIVVATFTSWYMQRPRRQMSGRLMTILGSLVGVMVASGIATIAWMSRGDAGLYEWGVTSSTLWVLGFIVVALGGLTVWSVRRQRGQEQAAMNLFFVHLASLAMLHLCGFTVLWMLTDLSLIQAIALGSVVFLPFDIVKAGLAVAATLPFLPTAPGGQKPDAESPNV